MNKSFTANSGGRSFDGKQGRIGLVGQLAVGIEVPVAFASEATEEGMLRNLKTLAITALLPLAAVSPASAGISPLVLPAVVKSCPYQMSGGCKDAVNDFLGLEPAGAERDANIITLVEALGYAAQHPNTTRPMCLELEGAIRVLGAAAAEAALKQQIGAIADALCPRGVETTGSIGSGFETLAPGNKDPTPGDPPPPPPPTTTTVVLVDRVD